MAKISKDQPQPNLWVFLMGDVFEVHAVGCKTIPSRRKKQQCQNEFPFTGTDERQLVLDLWDDHIAEGANADDPDKAYDEYAGYVELHGCAKEIITSFEPPKKAQANGTVKMTREQKRELATLVVEAAAKMASFNSQLPDGVTQEDANKAISHWLHHLPADRDRWVKAGLPKPDRSDWR